MPHVRLFLLCSFVLLCSSTPVRAADCTYASSGLWSNAANWSCGSVPGPDDHAILPGGRLVTVDAPATVGQLTLSGAQFTTAADLTVTTTLTWSGGFLTGQNGASLVLAATATGSITGGVLHTDALLVNHGTLTFPSGFTWSGSGTLDNRGTFEVAGSYSVRTLNSGTLRKTSTSTATLGSTLITTGTVDVQAGTLLLNGSVNSIGGASTVSAGATLQFGGSSTHQAGVTGAGTLSLTGGVQTIAGDLTWSVATVSMAGAQVSTTQGSATISGAFAWSAGFLTGGNGNALVLTNTATGTITGGIPHTDSLLVNHGTISFPAGFSWSGSGTLDNRGTFEVAGGYSVRTLNTGTLRKTGTGTATLGNTLTTTGTVQVQEGTLQLNGGANSLGGAMAVSAGATLRMNNSSTHVGGTSITGAGTLNLTGGVQTIAGDLTWSVASVSMAGAQVSTTQGSATVSGAFEWSAGFLTGGSGNALALTNTATGTVTGGVPHTDALLVNHGTLTFPTGFSWSGSGTLDNRGTFEVAGSYSVRTLNTGTLRKTGTGTATLGNTLTTTGTVQVQEGTLQLNGGANSIGGTVAVVSGATFRVNNSSTFQAGLVQSGTGVFEFSGGTVAVLAAWAHQGETRATGANAIFDNAASVAFAALTHTAGFLDIQRPSATITGPFTRTGGTLRLAGSTLTFAGTGTQLLDVSVATTFVNLVVSPTTTLVEVQAGVAAQVSGTLTNLGVIRKTRTMAAGSNGFGLTGVSLDVAALGSLGTVQVDRRDVNHPSAGTDQQTGRFWTMTPSGAGFVLSVTLPHGVANHQAAGACRFTGSAWDCGRSSSTATTVTRSGVTTLSDWAVGTSVSPSYSITGTIRLDGVTPMNGVGVALAGSASTTARTDANGAYAFPGLQSGTYTVTPSLSGYTFTPPTHAFNAIGADQVGDFTGVKVWSVSGTVRDLNDTGVPGVTVNVTGSASRTTVTDADGRYAFADLPEGGTYVVTASRLSFAFTPASQTFPALSSDRQAAFFLAEVGTFVRYFAEGATGPLFTTEIALLNATGSPTTATLRFQRDDGVVVPYAVPLAGLAQAIVRPGSLPGLEATAFSTVVEATQPVIADRTMRWDARAYGSHAETSIAAPATEWFLAEGATIAGFNLFYLIQNPTAQDATVEVTYLLPAPQAPVVREYPVQANSRFSIWVNFEAPELAAAEVSAVIRSLNAVPLIVERAMYMDRGGRQFDSGHAGAGVTAAATEWFLAEGATGDYFDLFVLIANPQATAAEVRVDYLLPDGRVVSRDHQVAAQSRFNIWVDLEGPELASTAVSTRVRSTNGVPIVVERAMWWPGQPGNWHEGHNSVGAVRTSTKWGLAGGEVGGAADAETYILIANTSSTGGTANITLVFEDGTTAVRTFALLPNSRETVPVGFHFPEAAGRRFGAVVESFGAPAPEIVVERAMYSNSQGVTWAAGSNVVGTRLR